LKPASSTGTTTGTGRCSSGRGSGTRYQKRTTATETALGDLLIITPSRGRPRNIARLLDAVHDQKRLETHVCVAIDDDDPDASQYEYIMGKAGQDGDVLRTGPRKGLTAWTNEIAAEYAGRYRFLASFGDDHVPGTRGFDAALCRGIEDMGGTGFSHPWTGTREDVPEAVVVSSDIVQALGWMCNPALEHWYIDDTWAALGRGAGCIRHLRAVKVEHLRAALGRAPVDATAHDSGRSLDGDRDAYWAWRRGRATGDIQTVLALREKALQPA
jgi:hypothetical protein